ncbi:DUF4307 domain-containing protein [Corynebacterium anserum]|uniref:DUF4307 domain-containing protein n=1 Tax=Corynebacterium anserum TaxID=2684406 RepID=A0A7G7YPD8_9CORY|nr:DUF4307 domain-containing protein [Corynebacterium anserum]MBC2681975.1 DUF4307 domain-containing protein [Corynebacterium anserum]QNH96358.1 DUF4307 domain-containing protein [Corynebacterium anserum]
MKTVDTPVLKERYGNSRDNNFAGKILVIIFAAMIIAAGIYIVSMMTRMNEAKVDGVETGGTINSDHLLTSQIDITRDDPSKAAYCIITALNYAKAEVGRREILLPPGGQRVTRVEMQIPTFERAHAAKVYGCSNTIPPHLSEEATARQ